MGGKDAEGVVVVVCSFWFCCCLFVLVLLLLLLFEDVSIIFLIFLELLACQVIVTVGDTQLCYCVPRYMCHNQRAMLTYFA